MSENVKTKINGVTPTELEDFCVKAMLKCGMSEDASRIAAGVLVTTDTWGVHSHGTRSLRQYLKRMRAGGLNCKAVPEIIKQGNSWAMVDGHNALAMVTGYRAMEIAIEKAKSGGIAYVGVRNSCHFGAAGYYANMAAQADMIGIVMSNVDPNMTIPGTRGRGIGSNPLAYAVPADRKPPVLFDIALSSVAAGKIDAARFKGTPIPGDWLMDLEGVATTNPNLYPKEAALAPLARHKGYGLALMVEVLSAVLSGAGVLSGVKSWVLEDLDKPTGQGHAFIAINVAEMMPIDKFKKQMDEMICEVKGLPKAKGSNGIFLPGEMEWEKRNESLEKGIQLPDEVLHNLKGLAEDLDLEFEEFLN